VVIGGEGGVGGGGRGGRGVGCVRDSGGRMGGGASNKT